MKKYDVVIWAHHGMFCSGEDFDLTFGLLHTVEKSAEILVKVMSMAPRKLQTITPDDFRAVAKDFHVTLPEGIPFMKKNSDLIGKRKTCQLRKVSDRSFWQKNTGLEFCQLRNLEFILLFYVFCR